MTKQHNGIQKSHGKDEGQKIGVGAVQQQTEVGAPQKNEARAERLDAEHGKGRSPREAEPAGDAPKGGAAPRP